MTEYTPAEQQMWRLVGNVYFYTLAGGTRLDMGNNWPEWGSAGRSMRLVVLENARSSALARGDHGAYQRIDKMLSQVRSQPSVNAAVHE